MNMLVGLKMSYEEGINELYDFVEGNRVIGCIYDW